MKTLQDMVGGGDIRLMVFADMLEWPLKYQNASTGEIKEFEIQAFKTEPPVGYDADEQDQYCKDKKLPQYANFKWFHYEVFCNDVWIGRAKSKNEMMNIAREYALGALRSK